MSTYERTRSTAGSVPEGYDRLTARDAVAWLRGLPLHELEELRCYEERGKARSTVLHAIDVRLDELEGPIVLPSQRRRQVGATAAPVATEPELAPVRRMTLASLPPAPPSEPFQEVEWPECTDDATATRRWGRGTIALVGAAAAMVATVGVVQPW